MKNTLIKIAVGVTLLATAIGVGGCESKNQCLETAYNRISTSSLKNYQKDELRGYYDSTKTRTAEDEAYLVRIKSDINCRHQILESDVFKKLVTEKIADGNNPCDEDFLVTKRMYEAISANLPGLNLDK
jgi:hypothetical protein